MRPCTWIFLTAIVAMPLPVAAQFIGDYGGGWGPSLDTSISLGRDVLALELGARAGGSKFPSSRQNATSAVSNPPQAFFTASAPAPGRQLPKTRFARSAAVTQAVQDELLAELGRRQPGAVAEYRAAFSKSDWAKGFEDVTRPYGLSASDPIDALTAYWVMAWIVANGADLPTPESVRAVRKQVLNAYADSALIALDEAGRQRVTDQAIFNFLVLNGAWRNEAGGANAQALSNATQRNFMPLGGNLRGLTLTKSGFHAR